MKKLLLFFGFIACLCPKFYAQNHFIEVMPFNPDVNSDFKVTSVDLLSFLGVYDTEFGMTPPSCDYDGTSFEEFYFGLMNMEIILDSMFIQYTLYDVNEYYVVGCPEPVTDTLEYTGTAMLNAFNQQPNYVGLTASNHNPHIEGGYFSMSFDFRPANGEYVIVMNNNEISPYLNSGFFAGGLSMIVAYLNLPFSADLTFDEDGLDLSSLWNAGQWAHYATEFVMLPYWHYAE